MSTLIFTFFSVCGNWFFHMTGLYSFVLATIYGITLYTQSEYSDLGLLEAIVENKVSTATMYSWQVSFKLVLPHGIK